MECHKKSIVEFQSYETEVFDSLDECCHKKFPNSVMSCCDAKDEGGCDESGVLKWLPDWFNSHCYAKVSRCFALMVNAFLCINRL